MKMILAFAATASLFVVGCSTAPKHNGAWEYKTVVGGVFSQNEPRLDTAINTQITNGWQFVTAGQALESWGFAVMKREKK
jgi:hypothetical protein